MNRPLTDEDYELLQLEADDDREASEHYGAVMAECERLDFAALKGRLEAGDNLMDYELARYERLRLLGHPKSR